MGFLGDRAYGFINYFGGTNKEMNQIPVWESRVYTTLEFGYGFYNFDEALGLFLLIDFSERILHGIIRDMADGKGLEARPGIIGTTREISRAVVNFKERHQQNI